MLFPCCIVGSLPPSEIQSLTHFFNVDPSHGLPCYKVCSIMGHVHWVQSFRHGLLQGGLPTESQLLPEDLLLWGIHSISHRLQLPTGPSLPSPVWGPPCAAGGYELHCGPPWTAGDSLRHHGPQHGLQGNLCSRAWSTSCPPSLTLVSARLFLSHFSHSSHCCCTVVFILS